MKDVLSSLIVSFLVVCLSSANTTGTSGGDETDLATRGGTSLHCGGLTDVLVVTTSVRMLHGVHGHTTDLKHKPTF